MSRQFPIRHKLLVIVLLILAPIALQVALFIQQTRKDIDFSSAEIIGVDYLSAIWPALAGQIADMTRAEGVRLAGRPRPPSRERGCA